MKGLKWLMITCWTIVILKFGFAFLSAYQHPEAPTQDMTGLVGIGFLAVFFTVAFLLAVVLRAIKNGYSASK